MVHVSQGTVANTDFDELIRPTLTALADEDVTVVVTTGGPPVAELGPLPANTLAAEFIPHDKLLPKTDVFVTNGGYGALHYAMAPAHRLSSPATRRTKRRPPPALPGPESASTSRPAGRSPTPS